MDPVAERKAKAAATVADEANARQKRAIDAFTVGKLIEAWQSGHLAQRSASYQAEAPQRLRSALARWAAAGARTLDRAAAVEALDAVKLASGPIAANRVRAYGRACFGWAVSRGTIPENPFATVPRPSIERSRERVLDEAELHLVWRAVDGLAEPWRAMFKLLILTGQRRGEVAGMLWSELKLEPAAGATWSMPGSRTKNGRPHDVPLAATMREVIAAVPRFAGCPLVFSQGRKTPPSGFGKAKERLDALVNGLLREDAAVDGEAAEIAPWTLHDLRRTVATGLQRQGVRLEVTEAILNHVSGSRAGIVGVYQRHAWADEKRAALEVWAGHVAAGLTPRLRRA